MVCVVKQTEEKNRKMNLMRNKILLIALFLALINFTCCYAIPEHLLPKDEDTPKILIEKARNLYEEGYSEKSIEVYTIILEKHKSTADRSLIAWAYYEKGFVLYMQRKWDESLECFEEVVKNYERDNQGAYILAYSFVRRIHYAKDTGNEEILIHRSSYAIPDNYTPNIELDNNKSENQATNSESEESKNNDDSDANNNDSSLQNEDDEETTSETQNDIENNTNSETQNDTEDSTEDETTEGE